MDLTFFNDFKLPMKNYWRENSWKWVTATVHTAPNIPEPTVNRDDSVEQEVLEALQYWSANERNSFYSHSPSWVAGRTGVDEDVVTRVLEKVQGELFAFEPPESLYFVGWADNQQVETRGNIGRLAMGTKEEAIERATERANSNEDYDYVVIEITPGEDTLVTPFSSTDDDADDWYVISYLGHAEKEVVAQAN